MPCDCSLLCSSLGLGTGSVAPQVEQKTREVVNGAAQTEIGDAATSEPKHVAVSSGAGNTVDVSIPISLGARTADRDEAVDSGMVVLQEDGDWSSMLGHALLEGGCEVETEEALASKEAVALLFAAKWCPSCRNFVPTLASSYLSALKDKGLAVVFVSSDHTDGEFNSFFTEMPWLALPFRDRDRQRGLHRRYCVAGLPKLVILSRDGSLICKDGRSMVDSDPMGCEFPWRDAECDATPSTRSTRKLRTYEQMRIAHQNMSWSQVALGLCVPALCCWWIPLIFFMSVQNFTDTCETDLDTWMRVFSVLILVAPPLSQFLIVLSAKLGGRACYCVVSHLNWITGLVICGYYLYGMYLYENSTYVMCYDGHGLNPMVIMRILFVMFIVCMALVCLVLCCICCTNSSDQFIVYQEGVKKGFSQNKT